jgi:hypothetical protein
MLPRSLLTSSSNLNLGLPFGGVTLCYKNKGHNLGYFCPELCTLVIRTHRLHEVLSVRCISALWDLKRSSAWRGSYY